MLKRFKKWLAERRESRENQEQYLKHTKEAAHRLADHRNNLTPKCRECEHHEPSEVKLVRTRHTAFYSATFAACHCPSKKCVYL